VLARADELDAFEVIDDLEQAVGQRLQLFPGKHRLTHEALQSLHKADDRRQVFGPGAALMLMTAAHQHRVWQQWRFQVERAGAFWPVNLVRADRNQVGIELVDVLELFLAEPLNGVGVKQYPALAANRP